MLQHRSKLWELNLAILNSKNKIITMYIEIFGLYKGLTINCFLHTLTHFTHTHTHIEKREKNGKFFEVICLCFHSADACLLHW